MYNILYTFVWMVYYFVHSLCKCVQFYFIKVRPILTSIIIIIIFCEKKKIYIYIYIFIRRALDNEKQDSRLARDDQNLWS